MATQEWVAERVTATLKKNSSIGAKALKEKLWETYKVVIPYSTVWKGRDRAMKKIFGNWDDSFDWLYRFKAEVEMRCPGSVIEIGTLEYEDGSIHFDRFFCSFKSCIDGFLTALRPYLSIDSTVLNGKWTGHLCAANALDAHNWMYPVAFGFIESESKDNWTWFMEQLAKCVGNGPNDPIFAICTNACKGLEAAVKQVFPRCEHRECFRHLMENFKRKYAASLGNHMYPAARAYRLEKHECHLNKVIESCPDVATWLKNHHHLLWMKSKFSQHTKCDYINNNLAESWNAWIKEYKGLPVNALADAIREKTLVLWDKRRKIGQQMTGVIIPAVLQQLRAATRGLGHLEVVSGGDDQAEVSKLHDGLEVVRHVVYPTRQECTCLEWQMTGKPCPHALAVIISKRRPVMEQYVHPYYSVACFQAAYAGQIPSITDKNQWPQVDKGFKLQPPDIENKGPGRYRKNRFKSCLEQPKAKKKTSIKRQVKCSKCGEVGHREGSKKCSMAVSKKR